MFGAVEERTYDEEDTRGLSAFAHPEYEDQIESEGEDRHAMMGRRDYDFYTSDGDEEPDA